MVSGGGCLNDSSVVDPANATGTIEDCSRVAAIAKARREFVNRLKAPFLGKFDSASPKISTPINAQSNHFFRILLLIFILNLRLKFLIGKH